MKENLVSFKIVSAVILAGVVVAFSNTVEAATDFARSLPLLAPNARTPSSESILRGTLVDQDGQTAISSIDLKWDAPTGTGALNEASVTAAGLVASRDANLERKADGTLIARGTMTDFDGRSVNYTETLRRVRNGFVAHGTTSGLAGETCTYETTVTLIGRNELRRTTVTTKSDGTTATHTETIKSQPS
jgi:hypothetical protein